MLAFELLSIQILSCILVFVGVVVVVGTLVGMFYTGREQYREYIKQKNKK